MLKTSRRATICSALLNTSKGVIRNRELVLATEEMSASLGKKRVTNIKRIIIGKKRRKNRNKRLHPDIQPTPHSQGGEGIWVERIEQYATAPRGASNAKSMDTTGKLVEDDKHVPNAVKKTRIILRKSAWRKRDARTANKITRITQDLPKPTKKKKRYLSRNTRGICLSWKQGK